MRKEMSLSISAMIASFTISLILQLGFDLSSENPEQFSLLMFVTVLGSTIIWVTVTFITSPEDEKTLVKFYERVRPAGLLWKKIYTKYNLKPSDDSLGLSLRAWIIVIIFIYSFFFAVGNILFGEQFVGLILFAISLCTAILLWMDLKRL